ncbi:hypothetical protein NHU_02686 [Rhodovulum sulfidophilum]|uniref:Uncharacterized protein n=1 Tax=Rhodovulum sulfidophilum TaxID=35806 RepID=A0A0D6B541_RHOSU|nr:hypothetical protein NHU_02686 [Rhodovulum sulfidophilum]
MGQMQAGPGQRQKGRGNADRQQPETAGDDRARRQMAEHLEIIAEMEHGHAQKRRAPGKVEGDYSARAAAGPGQSGWKPAIRRCSPKTAPAAMAASVTGADQASVAKAVSP